MKVTILSRYNFDPHDDNIDVKIQLDDGRFTVATFATIRNLERIMKQHALSGESLGGKYLWISDLIIVERLELSLIEEACLDLYKTNDYFSHAEFYSDDEKAP